MTLAEGGSGGVEARVQATQVTGRPGGDGGQRDRPRPGQPLAMPVTPLPSERPKATTPPMPIGAVPPTFRPGSRGFSQPSQQIIPRHSDPRQAPDSTPATRCTEKLIPRAVEAIRKTSVRPARAVTESPSGARAPSEASEPEV